MPHNKKPYNTHTYQNIPMKLFNAITAAAVIGTSLVAVNPAEASLFIDLDAGMRVEFDDTNNHVFVKKGSVTRIMRNVNLASKPIPSSMVSKIKSELRARGVQSFSTGNSGNDVQRVGMSGGGKVYAMRGIDSNMNRNIQQQFPHMEEVDVGHWTIYSLVK